jgi:hypothetical protein
VLKGAKRKVACNEQIKTGRSNRAAGFSLSRASVPKISRPCGASTLFDESRRCLIIRETLTHQKRGRPLLNPLNYGAKPLFHWRLLWASARSQVDVIGGRSHARKMLQFCKKRCSFQKA